MAADSVRSMLGLMSRLRGNGSSVVPASTLLLPDKAAPRAQMKTVGSGVQWVGSPDFRTIIRLDAVVDPDAEELTRAIALATSAYCFTAINYRMRKVSEPPLYVAQLNEEGGEEALPDHELMGLLTDPSPRDRQKSRMPSSA